MCPPPPTFKDICSLLLHWTILTTTQHPPQRHHLFPSFDNAGDIRESYTNASACIFHKAAPKSTSKSSSLPETCLAKLSLSPDYEWLEKVRLTEKVQDEVTLTWSSHHAAQRRSHEFEVPLHCCLFCLSGHILMQL